ncbi:MAG: 3-dehydroquinate synthase [Acholeplasma sp.]|nr:3-dehydroquinate synthase [Acholeplasma sp.]
MKITMGSYEILLSSNEFSSFNEKIIKIYQGGRLFVVTDKEVFNLYHEIMRTSLKDFKIDFVIAENKSFTFYEETINKLLDLEIKKTDMIVALGGGTIGDLTGFVAATLFRGIDYIQIPTTLLAQIDSSIGGKTAIDTKYGKNLVGSFYNPKLVLIDSLFLQTLNKREYNNGLAEAIKMALLFDKELFERIYLAHRLDIMDIKLIIDYKRKIVVKDPLDQGIRKILNFGHTFGHAIEKTNAYQVYKHGEAISYGMLIALELSARFLKKDNKEIYLKTHDLFLRLGLIKDPILNYRDYLSSLKYDKKNTDNGLDFVLLEEIGKPKIMRLKVEEL